MKRITIAMLALLCALTLMSCNAEKEPGVRQQWILSSTERIEHMTLYTFNDSARYELYFPHRYDYKATLKVWTKDMMTDTWPEKPTLYTGSMSGVCYTRTISETAEMKKDYDSYIYSVVMESVRSWDEEQDKYVDDPMYEPTLHSYDGVFDVSFVSGYGVWYNDTGGEVRTTSDELTVRFEVSMNSNEAPSVLIGLGNWSCQKPW